MNEEIIKANISTIISGKELKKAGPKACPA